VSYVLSFRQENVLTSSIPVGTNSLHLFWVAKIDFWWQFFPRKLRAR
jgi:hypothetical protein